jgi:hypothetical protein
MFIFIYIFAIATKRITTFNLVWLINNYRTIMVFECWGLDTSMVIASVEIDYGWMVQNRYFALSSLSSGLHLRSLTLTKMPSLFVSLGSTLRSLLSSNSIYPVAPEDLKDFELNMSYNPCRVGLFL